MEPFITHTGRGRAAAAQQRRHRPDHPRRATSSGSAAPGSATGCSRPGARTRPSCSTSPRYAGATILVAGPDFGTGSSREHAVWALADYGFRAVIAPRFGDIFRDNATKAGLLPVLLPATWSSRAAGRGRGRPGREITVDLDGREVRCRRPARPRLRRAVRDRRLHAVAADGGSRRHRR